MVNQIEISDAFIKEERIHPTEVTENAKELGRRIDQINKEFREEQDAMRKPPKVNTDDTDN